MYNFQCDLWDAEYVGYTSQHLHHRIDEHRFWAIGKHVVNHHGIKHIGDLSSNFGDLKKRNEKLDCLIYELLFIKKNRLSLNTQSDSIRAKLFGSVDIPCTHTYYAKKFLSSHIVYIKLPWIFILWLKNDVMATSKRCVFSLFFSSKDWLYYW